MTSNNESVTLAVAGAQLTVGIDELFRAWLTLNLGKTIPAVIDSADSFTCAFPALAAGELYVGAVISADRRARHHIILLPGEIGSIEWKKSIEWAASVGGDLPDLIEQAMLFVFLRSEFKEAAYWSKEANASDSDYAWYQHFDTGSQNCNNKGNKLRARAVRRVLIINEDEKMIDDLTRDELIAQSASERRLANNRALCTAECGYDDNEQDIVADTYRRALAEHIAAVWNQMNLGRAEAIATYFPHDCLASLGRDLSEKDPAEYTKIERALCAAFNQAIEAHAKMWGFL